MRRVHDDTTDKTWSEWWIIGALLGLGLAMIAAGILIFPGELWLPGLGMIVVGAGIYGVAQEVLGAVIDRFAGRGFLFLGCVVVFFLALIANGYWSLSSP